ncbi:LuxR C-terminal-related transcriptional regulator [Burkholderia cepacia]|uniref:helix-turn-helix transcriptional regulator n=1 Tax=Burkholderia cepacia TaxID=292 RepID=UPI001F1FDE3F|nr:LuxR C-terminal-related transcriptional regulator [Burkholderia cepacia]MCE4128599.1 LuxR C-terminal-related transcriptional regulator [Burkholderia cepacia]MDN7858179.1 LuxR C-terminal-related transcriptional regulator [Burkholderia cepacia]
MRITTDIGQDLEALRDVPAAIVLDDFAWPPLPSRRADFDGVTRGDASQRELGLMLLDLYAVAARSGIGEFEYRFFSLLQALIPFDAAWTGVATHVPTGPVMHNSFLYRLPHAFFSDWKRVRDCDPLAHRTLHGAHGHAVRLSVVEPGLDARFRDWCVKYGLAQLMCVCTLDRRFGLTTFMSIYRQGLNRPFSDDDARRFEEVIPHLAAALTINRAAQLTRERGDAVAPAARALCDNFGVLHHADHGFDDVLRTEWPAWAGARVPEPLVAHLRRQPAQPFVGDALRIQCVPVAGLFQIEARPRSLLDRLSPRELAAIRHYGAGRSHKEVAQQMAISPTTVRHYLRCAYRKLGMHDKSQIAGVLGATGGAADDEPVEAGGEPR